MKLKGYLFLLFILQITSLNAQVEVKIDSLNNNGANRQDSLSEIETTKFIRPETIESVRKSVHPFNASDIKSLNRLPESHMQLDLSYPQDLAHWQGGAIYGGNNEEIIHGFGAYRTASAIAYQQLGKLRITGGITVEKFNFYRNIGNGIEGQVEGTYRFNDNISATAFGRVQNMGFFSPYSIITYQYGGYFSFNTNNNKWGLDLGAQRYFNPVTRTWTTIPIAMPYYKFQGQKLGIDFGGLLYNLFINVGENLNPHDIKPMPKVNSPLMPKPNHP